MDYELFEIIIGLVAILAILGIVINIIKMLLKPVITLVLVVALGWLLTTYLLGTSA